jgi:oligopeptide transport system ATP-binding protein
MAQTPSVQANGDDLLVVRNLKKYFPIKRGVFQRTVGHVQAVDGVSFTVKRGETLGLVGESGCGKSTTGKAILQLDRPTAGEVYVDGEDLVKLKGEKLRQMRRRMQIIFQVICLAESTHDRRRLSPSRWKCTAR